jgi:hypothetical protein
MPKKIENLKTELYDWLQTQGIDDIKIKKGTSNDSVIDPADADLFIFKYIHGEYDYGTVSVGIDSTNSITIFYNNNVIKNPDIAPPSHFTDFIKKMNKWGRRHGAHGFKTKNMDQVHNFMKRRELEKNRERSELSEGYYGNRHTSYSDSTPPTIKMIIKHTKALGEGDQRFRHIDRIFIENAAGERVLCPTNRPSEARMFIRHMAEGGEYRDDRWKHLSEICEDIRNLGGFIRATKSEFNESAGDIITETTQKLAELRDSVKRLSGPLGYKDYFNSLNQRHNN